METELGGDFIRTFAIRWMGQSQECEKAGLLGNGVSLENNSNPLTKSSLVSCIAQVIL